MRGNSEATEEPKRGTARDPREGLHAVRAERLVAAARVVLAAASLTGLWLDPSEPARHAELTFLLVAGYLAVAALVALAVLVAATPLRKLAVATHVFDLAMFGLVIYVTRGPSSPFFVFLIFALVSAALRWQWAGILWTGAAALAILVGTGLLTFLQRADPEVELNRFIIRAGYLVVVAVLLGYLGNHEKRLRSEVSKAAAVGERMRLAHDLHDGVVQSLTGATLRLGTLPALMAKDPAAARETVERVEELLRDEQRDLRTFMEEARELLPEGRSRPLAARLEELFGGTERHWNLAVDWRDDLGGAKIPAHVETQVCRLLREALVNAARHGEATRARVRIEAADGRLTVQIADNGRGFPFRGRYSAAELHERGVGPKSLLRRVAGLEGSLTLESSRDGAKIVIEVPLGPAGGTA